MAKPILAIETSAPIGGVALWEGGALLGERALGETTRQHAAALLPELEALLQECNRGLDSVAAIALSIGPGSFTGLRIGLATALGLCFGTGRRIVPVSTLAALAQNAGEREPVVPMLDARKGQVYAAVFDREGSPQVPDRVTDPLPWLEELAKRYPDRIFLLGPGARLFRNEIRTALGERGVLLGPEYSDPRARNVARLGAELLERGAALAPEEVELRYLRRAEAEDRRRAGHPTPHPISLRKAEIS